MATTFPCPKGHSSVDDDFCSECGAKMQNGRSAAAAGGGAAGRVCPDCGAPAPAAGVNFCEICGYNFITRVSGQFPEMVKPAATPPQPALPNPAVPNPAVPQPAVPNLAVPNPLTIVVAVDPSLRTPASPEPPQDLAPVLYSVDKPVNLLGRKSEARAIFPEIPLDSDSAVSHRHGVISQTPDGSLIYRDLGSSNGTRLNGTELAPLVDTPLKTGDELTMGHWTRITVKSN